MVPTIDFSLIGIILAIWNVFRIIWDYTCRAFNWITQRALALLIGSKIWATAFFIGAFALIISLLSVVYNAIFTFIASLVVSSIPSEGVRDSLLFASNFFPFGAVLEIISMCFSGLSAVFIAENYVFWWMHILDIFYGLTRSHRM